MKKFTRFGRVVIPRFSTSPHAEATNVLCDSVVSASRRGCMMNWNSPHSKAPALRAIFPSCFPSNRTYVRRPSETKAPSLQDGNRTTGEAGANQGIGMCTSKDLAQELRVFSLDAQVLAIAKGSNDFPQTTFILLLHTRPSCRLLIQLPVDFRTTFATPHLLGTPAEVIELHKPARQGTACASR